MYYNHLDAATRTDHVAICPSCGSTDPDDNSLDERLYAEAAREVPRLRYEGRTDEAVEVLSALFAIRICNTIRPRWRCCTCGAAFDGYHFDG